MAGTAVGYRLTRVFLALLACWGPGLHAQTAGLAGSLASAPIEGERLSDWLLRQPADPGAYTPGLLWQVPAEQYTQADLKRELLVWLKLSESAPASSRASLIKLIEDLPVTGRVRVPLADARWLQAHPKDDPVLQRDHRMLLPRRPGTVTVLTNDGQRCTLPHRPGSQARDYLDACDPGLVDRMDRSWMVQPDGSVHNFGIGSWNAQAQDEVAPGAVLWAPARGSGWSPEFSTLLAKFLATQAYGTLLTTNALADLAPPAPIRPGAPARDLAITANDWGLVGLLQTPTARMAKVGEARFGYSLVAPYERYNTIMQPLDWLEGGFRYTNIRNRLYGPESLSGNQTFKDKSVDFKVMLLRETAVLPQLAIGITDVGGTGLFSSEYVVANKRTGNFDWSLGMGWGNLGSSGNVRNPLTLISRKFDTRATSAAAGTVSTGAFFRGPAALFGGVQYQTPWDDWLIKAEYDGNNYQNEPQGNNHPQRLPVNMGVVYRYHPALDVSLGLERGDTLMLGVTLHTGLDRLDAPKVSDLPAPRISASRPSTDPIWPATAAEIMAMTGWTVRQIGREGNVLQVVIESPGGAYWNDRIERITAVLHRDAPAPIYAFEIIFMERGIPLSERIILREPWVKQNLQLQAMSDSFQAAAAIEPRGEIPSQALWKPIQARFGYGLEPTWQQNLGGPDGFLLFKAGLTAGFRYKISESTSINGFFTMGLLDNFANFKYTAPSNLPRVRTYLREYMTSTRFTMPTLQISHMGRLGSNQYYSLYGGYLENMYGGVGGEWLYRPWHGPLAFGIDVNQVQQRGFRQDFSFGNAGDQTGYRVLTGHATTYWDTGWKSTHVKLSMGRYLAGDIGATLDVSRTFNNGITIGAWATKTNISSQQFGEGSFDKGMYLRIPFDVMTTSRGGGAANLVYNPLTRDGGARLNRAFTLYGATTPRSKNDTGYRPASASMAGEPEDEIPAWAPERSLLGDLLGSGLNLGGQVAEGQLGHAALWSSGLVLASTLLDRPVANWANNHQGGGWNKLGKASSALPFVLAGGAGLLWWGLGGEGPTETAWTALKGTAFTVVADSIINRAVNRSRPAANLGAANFGQFGKGGGGSSFPSTHMGVAFSLVTPFAQDYDAPWLYAVAGATAFGRIQERQHFVSDVVAGGLLGYVTGSLLLDQQRRKAKQFSIEIGRDRTISSAWRF